MSQPESKLCISCNELKPLAQFAVCKGRPRAYCKGCWNLRAKQQRISRGANPYKQFTGIGKVCRTCGLEKSLENFGSRIRKGNLVIMARCLACHRLHNKERHLLKKYGITWADYVELYNGQQGCCFLCRRGGNLHTDVGILRLYVDHNHATGKIRKLLCAGCNTAVGHLEIKGSVWLRAALNYMEDN